MDMKDIFGATPKSSWGLFIEPGIAFYIPAYQREYSWDKANVDRLLEDLIHGMQMLLQSEAKDSVTFIGTLIVIHDTRNQTIKPYIKGELPGKVLLVIDGQQRLCTLLILNIALHEQMSTRLNQLIKLYEEPNDAVTWLINQVEEELHNLRMTFELDKINGEGDYRWYPRITRAYDDIWSKQAKEAKYKSPIASLIFGYMSHSRSENKKEYKHLPSEHTDAEKHKRISENFLTIRNWIKKIAAHSDEIEAPEWQPIIEDKKFQETLLSRDLPNEVIELLVMHNNDDDSNQRVYTELMQLLLFAAYLNRRVGVTVVTPKKEEYAFDMFEALNTTGTPLTAFETFRPRVIDAEGLVDYEGSRSQEYMGRIEDYLERYSTASDKQKATDRLLIPFALAESGYRLSKRLREQRGYLRQRYVELSDIDEKQDFVQHMAHIAVFIKEYWPEKSSQRSQIGTLPFNNPDLIELCLSVLRESKHEITVGIIARYFSQVRMAEGSFFDDAVNELEEAIKAVTAFWVFWRSVSRNTRGIDNRYRNVMAHGNPILKIPPFSRRALSKQRTAVVGYNYTDLPSAAQLKQALRYELATQSKRYSQYVIADKDDWIRLARNQPFYDNLPNPINRFLLLAATHDTYFDKNSPGLSLTAKDGTLPMLTMERWSNSFTIEHIVPQKGKPAEWEPELYEDPDLIHQIGNLTLLPPLENSIAGNQSWNHKRLIFSVISSPTQDELETQLKKAKKAGLEIRGSTQNFLEDSKFLPYVRAISMHEDKWNAEFIQQRSQRLLELAWDRLAPWLDF